MSDLLEVLATATLDFWAGCRPRSAPGLLILLGVLFAGVFVLTLICG